MIPICFNFLIFVFGIMQVKSMPVEDEAELMPYLSYSGDRVFRNPSPQTGKLLESWSNTLEVNPEELGEYAEGDIVFPKRGRNGLVTETARRPNGEIPYEISGYFDADSFNMIKRAINIYHKYTCIKFRQRTSDDIDHLTILSTNTGCWSSVGRIGGHENNFDKADERKTTGYGVPYDYRSVIQHFR